jgi:probable HAF family extracellular repeat protein
VIYSQTLVPNLGGTSSWAHGIGPQGQVVGWSNIPNGDARAFLFDSNGMRDLGLLPIAPPLGMLGLVMDISDAFAIGLSADRDPVVVGSSGFVPNGAGAIIVPMVPSLERAAACNVGVQGGTFREIGTLVPAPVAGLFLGQSHARAMNNKGQIVGVSDTTIAGPPRQAFLYDASGMTPTFTNLGTLIRDPTTNTFVGYSEALGINDRGQIVGVSEIAETDGDGMPLLHAFLYDIATQQMRDLGTLLGSTGSGSSTARAINNQGVVIGVSDSRDADQHPVRRGFVWEATGTGARMRDLGTLDRANADSAFFRDRGNSDAYGINDLGHVVGTADTATPDADGGRIRHAFRADANARLLEMESLQDAAWLNVGPVFTDAVGINDAGQICGNVTSVGGATSVILLTPGS